MSLNWTNVKSLAIPVGGVSRDVKRVSIGGSVVWEKSPLPPGARWVEYLESTGTQWIDTGYIATEDTRVVATLYTTETGNKNWFGGVAEGTQAYAFNSYSSSAIEYIFGNSGWGHYAASGVVGNVFVLDFGKDGVFINGTNVSTPNYTQFPSQTAPIAIFLRYGGSAYIKGRVYAFQIYEGSTLVCDFIPVRVGTTGALYDRRGVGGMNPDGSPRNDGMYFNVGTGAFGYGQDVVDITWVDDEYYAQNGSTGYNTRLARIDDYIAVTGGHSITWKWGDSVLGTCYLIVYNAQKQQIDYWVPNSATGERTINLNATGAFVRYSVGKSFKDTTFFKDNTTGLYAVRNGKILLP